LPRLTLRVVKSATVRQYKASEPIRIVTMKSTLSLVPKPMPFPRVLHCLVCKEARIEPENRLSLIDFYGVAPYASVFVQERSAPVTICFLIFSEIPDPGTYPSTLQLIAPDGTTVYSGKSTFPVLEERPPKTYMFGFRVNATFHSLGNYKLDFLIDDQIQYSEGFEIVDRPPGSL